MLNPSSSHFLVPTDFGNASRTARRAALSWAIGTGGRVTLLHVAPPNTSSAWAPGLDAIALLHAVTSQRTTDLEKFHQEMDQIVNELHPELKGFVDLRAEWRQGQLIAEITRFAKAESIDAIVLGAGPWRLRWGKSLGHRLARQTECQVVQVYDPTATRRKSDRTAARPGYAAKLLEAWRWPIRRSL